MTVQQIRKDIEELKKTIDFNDPGIVIPETPEVLKCSKELETAEQRARQQLIDSGISDKELKEKERDGLIFDSDVLEAHHNLLRAAWNAKNPDHEPIKIKYLFDTEL
jgi:hypothetical protein